jgi:hypothetical protein
MEDDIVTDLISALPGNNSVNTAQLAAQDEVVFSMYSAPRPVLVTDQWSRSLTSDTCFLCGLRGTTTEGLCFLWVARAEWMWQNVRMGINWTWVPNFQGNSSVARRKIMGLIGSRYMCNSTSILGVGNLVRLSQFLCYKSVASKRILKTSGNRLVTKLGPEKDR